MGARIARWSILVALGVAKGVVFLVITFVFLRLSLLHWVPWVICHYEETAALGLPWNTKFFDSCGMMIAFPIYVDLIPQLVSSLFFAWCVWHVTKSTWLTLRAR